MKIVAQVPVKLNNERLPGKNTKCFDNGNPLIHYILNTLKQVDRCNEIYVYCSDEKITEFLPDGVKFLQRNPEFDLPTCNSIDISKVFAKTVDADIYIYTHATAPFISANSINKAIDAIINDGHDSAFAVTENYAFMWIDGKPNYDVTCLPRTQDMTPFYIETCGFWLYKKEVILNHSRRIGFNPALIPVTALEAMDIDDKDDFDLANYILNGKMALEKIN